jgi:hypothetical protein
MGGLTLPTVTKGMNPTYRIQEIIGLYRQARRIMARTTDGEIVWSVVTLPANKDCDKLAVLRRALMDYASHDWQADTFADEFDIEECRANCMGLINGYRAPREHACV